MSTPVTPPPVPIFNYDGNINILEASKAYRREVEICLKRIASTGAGRILFKHIKARNKRMLIIPYKPNATDGWVNAFSAADNFSDSMAKDTMIGSYYTIQIAGFGPLPIPHVWKGTGAGSPVTIKFHPATFRQYNQNHGYIKPGSGPGEILYHEMVHSLQQMEGNWHSDAVVENPHMDNFGEFCAIVAANIYRSERGFTSLRADHHGFDKLGKHTAGEDLTNPAVFARVYAEPFRKWFGLQPKFCLDLAGSKARFNPLLHAAGALGHVVPTSMSLPSR